MAVSVEGRPQLKKDKGKKVDHNPKPAFEIIVLGSGGGPLETDCSGYLVKPAQKSWEDGLLALEGGSGLGALTSLLTTIPPTTLFPDITFPPGYNSPIFQAAYVFSFLTCYLITHAHLDHVQSLIMLSGSIPTRATVHPQPPLPTSSDHPAVPSRPCPPIFGTRSTLEKLALAYGGQIWPEIAVWAPEKVDQDPKEGARKRRRKGKVNGDDDEEGSVEDPSHWEFPREARHSACLSFAPLRPHTNYQPLHPELPFSVSTYPLVHGLTSRGHYDSSAMFIQCRPSGEAPKRPERNPSPTISTNANGNGNGNGLANRTEDKDTGRQLLFFGDLESSFRKPGEEEVDAMRKDLAGEMNRTIWTQAAKSWKEGKLAGIFIECSYESSRPAGLMYGHLSPPSLWHEMQTLATIVSPTERRPLEGLKVYITHIKDNLTPHPSGRTAREIIMSELWELEKQGRLGVEFIETKRGDRIVI
ncbi:hypothetical protein CI109_101455 [Kwoniella shandongensis]|uniref:Uncharacterized protein n=1 Tax=Kwoniella shandongensis TaxID=1734106 RepID=A0A5M6BYQ1_9TREE|nr:uncharacterized protein CI109_005151 [Kwoniella shandongensis]KAA5526575.1 hypothetical protein CI109_005151 [Kwoniella shandongensis]